MSYTKREKFNFPSTYNQYIALNETSPVIQNMVIHLFKTNDIPLYHDTKEFDPGYEYIYWSRESNYLCQTSSIAGKYKMNLDEFLDIFFYVKNSKPITIKLNSEYDAKVTSNTVQVGCQEISADVVLKIANEIKRLRKP